MIWGSYSWARTVTAQSGDGCAGRLALQRTSSRAAADTAAREALSLPLPIAARENEPHLLSTSGNMWLPWGEQERGESLSSIIRFN